MAERLKRAAAWLGLVTDDRYADYDDAAEFEDLTEEETSVEQKPPIGTCCPVRIEGTDVQVALPPDFK